MSVTYSPLRDADRVNTVGNIDLAPKHNTEPAAAPLLNPSAPLARIELDEDLDDREIVSKPYPGVDDGFFTGKDKNDHPDVETINPEHPKQPDPDVEIIPTHPKDPEPIEPPHEIPDVTTRNGFPGGKPTFPYAPGYGFPYGHDLEVGSIPGDPESIPDVNVYQHKKTLAQGMMDLALFSANANQLRYVLESFNRHPYYYPSLGLISVSLILQVAVGIGLIWNATYNVKDEKEICIANKISNFTIIGIFLVTVINVFISAFGVANPP
ncbi:uncharacterized protein LOC108914320 isoform X2 [Anoplophora glabripennis]|uniref:uncharacterized protein LOC108914320 isoform X2 n=1 Tax=Anoplophora glabripennis TaxID=217634 RepID=UPI000873A35E|nr:uncharacterized protein LOC108914320 isoform X2 [Anoplophora glabripennis]